MNRDNPAAPQNWSLISCKCFLDFFKFNSIKWHCRSSPFDASDASHLRTYICLTLQYLGNSSLCSWWPVIVVYDVFFISLQIEKLDKIVCATWNLELGGYWLLLAASWHLAICYWALGCYWLLLAATCHFVIFLRLETFCVWRGLCWDTLYVFVYSFVSCVYPAIIFQWAILCII